PHGASPTSPVQAPRLSGCGKPDPAWPAGLKHARLRGKHCKMNDFIQRLRRDLEPILAMADPREKISAYHDMPYAIFQYDPTQELLLRGEVAALRTRIENKGKRVTTISLAECLEEAMTSEGALEDWFENERIFGIEKATEDIH